MCVYVCVYIYILEKHLRQKCPWSLLNYETSEQYLCPAGITVGSNDVRAGAAGGQRWSVVKASRCGFVFLTWGIVLPGHWSGTSICPPEESINRKKQAAPEMMFVLLWEKLEKALSDLVRRSISLSLFLSLWQRVNLYLLLLLEQIHRNFFLHLL